MGTKTKKKGTFGAWGQWAGKRGGGELNEFRKKQRGGKVEI